ncbi:GGDEF domain-containing protein [Streptomyces luteoverticillatus]|uniref:GGDEF domain-containing protein n=1 Tax=Streptomyces luteoverticillatus TaxID=66425 RepID=A0A3Q9FZ15_STRLT|nr:GGDEF domain-containing protein [Streptomyces luteoverticillatus]AZQ73542.1 GGDEF domain-containing protein [Streptomyces luteoverticillatus]
MTSTLTTVLASAPLAAGWSLHALWWRHRIDRARRDPLTGLPGRQVFQRRAAKLLRARGAAVVLVDLDRFKALNDTYGHGAGDAVLATCAARLCRWAEEHGGCAARLGGDEFAAVILAADNDLPVVLDGLYVSMCRPVSYRDRALVVGASVGAYFAGLLPEPPLERAMRRADEAMYTAKRAGGGWNIADTPTPAITTTNGRRTGRPGTSSGGGR